ARPADTAARRIGSSCNCATGGAKITELSRLALAGKSPTPLGYLSGYLGSSRVAIATLPRVKIAHVGDSHYRHHRRDQSADDLTFGRAAVGTSSSFMSNRGQNVAAISAITMWQLCVH